MWRERERERLGCDGEKEQYGNFPFFGRLPTLRERGAGGGGVDEGGGVRVFQQRQQNGSFAWT